MNLLFYYLSCLKLNTIWPILAAGGNLSFSVLVYTKNPKSPINRLFALFSLILALWNLDTFLLTYAPDIKTALFFEQFIYLGNLALPLFFHFITAFLNLKPPKKLLYFLYSSYFALIFLAWFTLKTAISPMIKLSFGYSRVIDSNQELLVFLFLFCFYSFTYGYSFYLILTHLRRTKSVMRRNQLKYLLIATSIAFIGGTVKFALPIAAKKSLNWNIIISFSALSCFLYVLIIAFTVIKHRFLDLKMVIRKSMIYSIAMALVSLFYITLIFLLEKMLSPKIGSHSPSTSSLLIVMGLTLIFHPLKTKIEKAFNKLFTSPYLHQKVLEEVGKKINKFDDLHSFLNFIVENISKKMGIRTASIFLKEDKNFYKAKAYSNELKDRLQNCRFSSQKGLFKFFCQEEKEIEEESPLLAKLPLEEQEQITKELNLLGATVSIPVVSQGEVLGAINLSEKKNGEISSAEDLNLWQALSGELAIVIRNVSLYQELKNNYFDTIKALIETVEAKDPYTRGHCLRVTEYAINIARELKVEEEEIKQIQYAGILHDIGKIGLMEDILRKPGQLTDEEYSFIKKHPVIGERIIAPIRFLEKIKPIIRHHHERYDGKGYPDGLKGDKIPFFSRILAIADSYDAMTSNRPYRKSLGHEKACLEIKNNAGKQFDPAIVPVACEVLEKIQGKLEV